MVASFILIMVVAGIEETVVDTIAAQLHAGIIAATDILIVPDTVLIHILLAIIAIAIIATITAAIILHAPVAITGIRHLADLVSIKVT